MIISRNTLFIRCLKYPFYCISRVDALPVVLRNRHHATFIRLYSRTNSSPAEMHHLEKNPYYEKYTTRLKQLQETKPDEFQAKLDALEAAKRAEHEQRLADQAAASSSHNQSTLQGLDAILKLDLVADKSEDEITELWKLHHANTDCVFAVIPANEYVEMQRKAAEFPQFIYPVPRNEGYEYFVQNWIGHVCHFTALALYQAHRENALPCLSLTHYTELMENKGIVLMRGLPDTKIISIYEAQLLALQVKMYYGICAALKFNLVRHFNHAPESFHHEQLIREFENYKKDTRDAKLGTL